MKKYKIIICFLLSITFIFIVFEMKQSNNELEVKITSNYDKYSPSMSSVPGFPLIAAFEREEHNAYKIHWHTSCGSFIFWDAASGKVENKGCDVETGKETVYWSPNPKDFNSNKDVEVKVEVLGKNNKNLGATKITLIIKNGLVSIKY